MFYRSRTHHSVSSLFWNTDRRMTPALMKSWVIMESAETRFQAICGYGWCSGHSFPGNKLKMFWLNGCANEIPIYWIVMSVHSVIVLNEIRHIVSVDVYRLNPRVWTFGVNCIVDIGFNSRIEIDRALLRLLKNTSSAWFWADSTE